MKVILTKDVRGVGQRDTVQNVSDGHALNFLIPQGLAVQATPESLKALASRTRAAEVSAEREREAHAVWSKKLANARITIRAKANEQGHLYRQLTPGMVAEAVREGLGIEVPSEMLVVAEPVKALGEFAAEFKSGALKAPFTLSVVRKA